jgi:hypothetical protein
MIRKRQTCGASLITAAAVVTLLLILTQRENAIITDVRADNATYSVTINNTNPTITSVICSFNDTGAPLIGFMTPGGSFTMKQATNYDLLCNVTITDPNGWQDLTDGWVNMTWHRDNVAWNAINSNDSHYSNSSCKNNTGNGDSMTYECLVPSIKYWADAGTWKVAINSSDGTNFGTPAEYSYTITNVSTLDQTAQINFGVMNLGENGSSGNTQLVDKTAVTNNTGNTIITLQVQALTSAMNCTIGAIIPGNISYDKTSKSIHSACGNLTASPAWASGCTKLSISDCSGSCSTPSVDTSYWGVRIPSSGVGGSCQLQVSFIAAQGP